MLDEHLPPRPPHRRRPPSPRHHPPRRRPPPPPQQQREPVVKRKRERGERGSASSTFGKGIQPSPRQRDRRDERSSHSAATDSELQEKRLEDALPLGSQEEPSWKHPYSVGSSSSLPTSNAPFPPFPPSLSSTPSQPWLRLIDSPRRPFPSPSHPQQRQEPERSRWEQQW